MNIVVLRERQTGEARVALMPESVRKLAALKASVLVESGAGTTAARSDEDFTEAGATISATATGTQPMQDTSFDGHIAVEVTI